MVKALYPGSFDPVTVGHLDITARAAKLFDEVIVSVYDTPSKSLLFTTDERAGAVRAGQRPPAQRAGGQVLGPHGALRPATSEPAS